LDRVLYPGLPSHPQHDLACRQARGHGGVFSVFLQGGMKEAHRFLGGLDIFAQAVSLGGVESLVEHPWSMTHVSMPEQARRAMGITENLVRFSVGLEDADDLRADLEQALGA